MGSGDYTQPKKGLERPFEIGSEEHEHAWTKEEHPKWRAAYGTGGYCQYRAKGCRGDCDMCIRFSENTVRRAKDGKQEK